MSIFYRLNVVAAVVVALMALSGPLEARSRKGDKFFYKGSDFEKQSKWAQALEEYEKALSEDPVDAAYQMAVRRTRFQYAQALVDQGQKIRSEGKLPESLALFIQAYAIDPSSNIAEQEIRRTRAMIESTRKNPKATSSMGLTPGQQARVDAETRAASIQAVPDLKPISRSIASLKMTNQPVKVLFETLGKLAGINVLFDSEYQTQNRNFSIDLQNTTLEEALDHLSIITKSFWKPLSVNTIFVTNDNVTKRRDYEDNVVRVFYLQNVTSVQELQEVATAMRSVTEIRRVFTYNAQNAILVRGTVDQVALAEKLLQDLDKPKSEVVVDVVVVEMSRNRSRNLGAAITSGGTAGFSTSISPTVGTTTSSSSSSSSSSTTTTTGLVALNKLKDLTSGDFAVTLPSAVLKAIMDDRSSRVRQSPQLRAADGMKASLRIGDKVPTASGSYQAGIGTVGVSPLVNTQFQFIEVGVNVDLTPRVHGSEEVTMHIELEISNVRDRVDIGGISQPVIGQRKVVHDVRVRDGEVNIIGGLVQDQETKTINGIPGLSSIPVVRRLFTTESIEKSQSELLIVLVPHVVRSPDLTPINLRGVSAGNDQTVKLTYDRRDDESAKEGSAPVAPAAPINVDNPTPATPSGAKPTAPAAPAKLTFQPEGVITSKGSPVIVTLHVGGATDLFSAPTKLKWNPKLLRLTSVTPGVFLSGDGQRVNFTENTQNDVGESSVVLNRLPGAPGISGSGALITYTFQAIDQGKATISVTDVGLKTSQMQQIPTQPPQVSVEIR